MKRLTLSLLALFAVSSFATTSPYIKPVADRFSSIETNVTALQALPGNLAATVEGTSYKRIARVTYDVAVDGGTVGAHLLGVTLPAKAVIVRSFFRTDTQFVDAGSGTVALSCEDANNLKTATDITGNAVGVFVEGAETGAASAFVASIAAACEVTATVAGVDQSAGKLTLWIEYVVQD